MSENAEKLEIYKEELNSKRKWFSFNHPRILKCYHFLTDTPTYKKTLLLSLLFVFLFYLPFTISNLFFDQPLFFQLDYLYQYSSIVFDFQQKIFSGDFSTWDWKNAMGYDYFANSYYISLDFSIIPFFLFPFMDYYSVMWLSFLLKILVGTAVFSYLLKTYGFSNKTNLFMSVLYGTADLFLALNVFPSFTGIIVYVPLLLLSVEYIVQKKNYFLLPITVFFMFLSNFYWAWPLSLFLAFILFLRLMVQNESFLDTLICFVKSIFYFLLGIGLAGFLVLPVLHIMLNEPRMNEEIALGLKDFLVFGKQVYFKTIFKMIVPNLFAYRGYFHDTTVGYFLPTNHVIIFSSILSTYTLFQFILYPSFLVKKKLDQKSYSFYLFLQFSTLLFFLAMFIPLVAYIFSATTTPYLRYFSFFGFILMINLAFFYEHKLFNVKLLSIFLILSISFLFFANYYNDLPEIYSASFHLTDETISDGFIIAYIISLVILVLFLKKSWNVNLILITERITQIVLIFVLMIGPSFTSGVRHHARYGKTMNELLQGIEQEGYERSHYFLYYNDRYDLHPLNNSSYLDNIGTYGANDTFHSLINPYYKIYNETQHRRLYRVTNTPLFYYLYQNPTQWVVAQDLDSEIINRPQGVNSELITSTIIKELNSSVSVYREEEKLPLGVGFRNYYDFRENDNYFNYLWLDGLYLDDEKQIDRLYELGFDPVSPSKKHLSRYYGTKHRWLTCPEDNELLENCEEDADFPPVEYHGDLTFGAYDVDITREDAEMIFVEYGTRSYEAIDTLLVVDQNDTIYRCYTTFCSVPEAGIKSIVIGSNNEKVPSRSSIYLVDHASLEERYEELRKNSTYEVEIDGNTIRTRVKNEDAVIMNYKVGYAPGWTVTVDGEEVETFPAHGGLLSFELFERGDHEVILTYRTPGLKLGGILSTLSFLFLGGLFVIKRYNKQLLNLLKDGLNLVKENNYHPVKVVKALMKIEKFMEFIRFGVIGVFATLISTGVYLLLLNLVHRNLALTIGYGISFIFNYFASNHFTFKTNPSVQNGIRFAVAHGLNYVTQLLLLNLFVAMGLSEGLAIIPTYAISIPLNFVFVRIALKGSLTAQ